MNVIRQENCFLLQKESHTIARCTIQPGPGGILLTALSVDPCWQRRGYGSYLLKEVLRSTGGFVPGQASLHWLYATDAPAAFFARFGFVLKGDRLVRRRPEELTAVKFAQSILAGRIPAGGFAIDATCGNGHDTEFLCRTVGPAGRVLALDIQPAAIASTRARLEQGRFENFSLHCTDHSRHIAPGNQSTQNPYLKNQKQDSRNYPVIICHLQEYIVGMRIIFSLFCPKARLLYSVAGQIHVL